MVPPMSTAERLKIKNDLNRILRNILSFGQRTVLEKFGIYCRDNGRSTSLNFDGCKDSVLWQLRKELQNLKDSNGDGDGEVGADFDDEAERKALRAAMLKSRFAETIRKANGGRSDEWGRLKTVRRDEEDKQTRQEEINKLREAARKALELVEKKVDVVDNFKVMKELQMLMNGKWPPQAEERINVVKQESIGKRKKEEDEIECKRRRRQEQINREREAARKALELVEKNVVVEDNFKVMKEIKMLMKGTCKN